MLDDACAFPTNAVGRRGRGSESDRHSRRSARGEALFTPQINERGSPRAQAPATVASPCRDPMLTRTEPGDSPTLAGR